MPSPISFLSMAAVLAASTTAAAETPAEDIETIIVTAACKDGNSVLHGARELLSRTPGAVAVIANEAYEDRTVQGLTDLLRDVPGVIVQKRYGEESRLAIRGSGIGQGFHQRGVLLAQDGVPFAEADGFSDFQKIDPLGARYIEVYKGGNALRFGGAQLGGAVNLITPTGHTADYTYKARIEAGVDDFRRVNVAYANVYGNWDIYTAVNAMKTDGYREHSRQEQVRATVNMGYTFGQGRDIRVIAYGADIKQDIPGAVSLDGALNAPKQADPRTIAQDWARDQQLGRATLQTHWRFTDGLNFEGGLYATGTDLHHPIPLVIDQQSETQGAFGRFDWAGSVAGFRTDVYWGFSWRKGDLDQQLYAAIGGGESGFQFGKSNHKATGLDVFAEGRFFVIEQLALVAGGSYGRATRDYTNHLNAANDAEKSFDWFAPRFGLLWQNDQGMQVYANATRSVEPPHYGALVQSPYPGFVPVAPQRAWTAEVGTRGGTDSVLWDMTLYRSWVKGELLTFNDVYGLPSATAGAEKTIHQGLEAALDWRILEGANSLTLRQSYTFSDFHFVDDAQFGDSRLPVVPKHQLKAALRYEHESGFFAEPALEWRPEGAFVDYAGTFKAPGYAVLSLSAGMQITEGLKLFVDARNLTDKGYAPELSAITDASVAGANLNVFYPGEGRTVFAGIEYKF